ncbi:MAG: DUF3189 family protein [Dethiobacter sp.]|jgi:hypothetical protein|nr:DUF3189 family protein [Dethiobacter sp.]
MTKKIIYHCYGGAHSSIVAAAIHLGKFKSDKEIDNEELMKLTLFDRQSKEAHGQIHFFDFDEEGRQVYSVGCRNAGETVKKTLLEVAKIFDKEKDLHFKDTLHCVNIKMRVGGYISRRLGLVKLGRPIVLNGTRQAYPKLVELVAQTKKEVGP